MKLCPRCGKPVDRPGNQKYCKACHAAYMREWRKTHPPSAEEVVKDKCRSYTTVLVKRGVIKRQPCLMCNAEPAQAHHPDYDRPRLVVWLCKPHHRSLHRWMRGELPEWPTDRRP